MKIEQSLQMVKEHIRIGKGMELTNGVPEALEVLVDEIKELQAVNKMLEDMVQKQETDYKELDADCEAILDNLEVMEQKILTNSKTKTLSLPRLNLLKPTLESTALKLMEEAGELAQAIGKHRKMNGEAGFYAEAEVLDEIGRELLDVAQTAVTMMFVLEENHHVNIDALIKAHGLKLVAKGYMDDSERGK